MMKLTKVAMIVAIGLGASAAAHAQWAGGYAEAGIGPRAATTEVTVSDPPTTATVKAGDTELLGSLGAGWRWDTGNAVIGAGAFWNPAGKDAGELTLSDPGLSGSVRLEQKDHWGIGVEAGWKLAAPTLVYAKLAWNRAKFVGTGTLNGTSTSSNQKLDGVGFGLGVRHMFDKNTYAFAEWQQVEFEDKNLTPETRIEPRNTIGLIGVGWKF